MCPTRPPLGILRTGRLIGRVREREAIRTAIEAEGELRILHVIGDGGMGKTRLLEAIPEEILPKCLNKDRCQWGGILDLYHTDFHTSKGIEAAIIRALGLPGFTEYFAKCEEYEKLRRAGGDPRRLEEMRRSLRRQFVESFNGVTQQRRIVLCFDTVELIQYESDVVQQVCRIEPRGLEIRGWLLDSVSKMQNVVVILAGRRPPVEIWRDVQTGFAATLGSPLFLQRLSSGFSQGVTTTKEISPGQVKAARQVEIYLQGLSENETVEYLSALAEATIETDPDVAGKIGQIKDALGGSIHPVTGGVPLRLAMLIDMLLKDMILSAHLSAATYREIEARFVDWIGNFAPDVFEALLYAAWARKGIDHQLLQRLTSWDQQECLSILNALKQFVFVKTRPDTETIFLHDVMYDLMSKYVLRHRPVQRGEVSQEIIEDYNERMRTRSEELISRLTAEQLYYYLMADERDGYRHYSRLSEQALADQRLAFEMALRDELLRFFRERHREIPDYISRDCAIRWVKRYIATEDYRKALAVAESIRASGHGIFKEYTSDDSKDPYFAAALFTYEGEALAYLERSEDAVGTIARAVRVLGPIPPDDDYQVWSKAHILGRAYNNLGYVYSRQRRYKDALVEYERALDYFEEADIKGLRADTLKNKAMSLARQGELHLAREFAEDAERDFRSLSMRYGEALSLNTRGLIELQREESQDAEPLCRRSLQIFRELGDARGIGLAAIAVGWTLRKKGSFEPFYSEEVERIFEEGQDLLMEAIDIFETRVEEPARLREAYAQLGLTYRDRANRYREEGIAEREEIDRLEEQARHWLTRSIDRAKEQGLLMEQADLLEDLAEIHFNRGEYDSAEELLERSDQLIPVEYYITRREGLPSLEEADPNLWLILGKNRVLRGRMAFAQRDYEKAMEAYLLSKNYFALYSIDSMERDVRTGATRRGLRQLRRLPRETLEDLRRYTKSIAEEYGLSDTLGTDRTLRMLNVALQTVRRSGGQAEQRREQ